MTTDAGKSATEPMSLADADTDIAMTSDMNQSANQSKTLNETYVLCGDTKQIVSPPPQIADTPPRSSVSPTGSPNSKHILRRESDENISPAEQTRRRQMQDDIDWLAKTLMEFAYHQAKGDASEVVMNLDIKIDYGVWKTNANSVIPEEDVLEQLRVLHHQLQEAPDKVCVQVIFGWASYQMVKDGFDIQAMKREMEVVGYVQGLDFRDEDWKVLRDGITA